MNVLFIGRFQPFHLGHYSVISYILNRSNSCIIGIGSSQYSYTLENPFSYDERKEMILRVLSASPVYKFQIKPLPDIHDPPNWVEHVTKHVTNFKEVYTNNPVTLICSYKKVFP